MSRGWTGDLFLGMLKEEWRLQKAFVGGFGAAFFPLLIFGMTLLLITILPGDYLTGNNSLLFFHLFSALYGFMVGGIAILSDMIMTRRMGQVNLLLKMSQMQPMAYGQVLGIFYIKEIFFYVLYSIIPLSAGILIGSAIRSIPFSGAIMMSVTMFLAFLLGMSLSFLLSSLYIRSKWFTFIFLAVLSTAAILVWPLDLIPVAFLFHPYSFWEDPSPLMPVLSLAEAMVLSILAVLLARERYLTASATYEAELDRYDRFFGRISGASHLLSKEWLELKRSGTMGPVLFGFAGPLLAVYGMVYLFRTALSADLGFNSVFYGSLVGFFGVMTYSWLTNIEQNEALNVLPVSVPSLIEIKVVLFFLITSVLTSLYMLGVSILNGDPYLFPLALGVALANNTYTVSVTAWLTGLRANSMLLDGKTLIIFSSLVVPPLIALVIISFFIDDGSVAGAVTASGLSLFLLLFSAILMKRIRKRWTDSVFVI